MLSVSRLQQTGCLAVMDERHGVHWAHSCTKQTRRADDLVKRAARRGGATLPLLSDHYIHDDTSVRNRCLCTRVRDWLACKTR